MLEIHPSQPSATWAVMQYVQINYPARAGTNLWKATRVLHRGTNDAVTFRLKDVLSLLIPSLSPPPPPPPPPTHTHTETNNLSVWSAPILAGKLVVVINSISQKSSLLPSPPPPPGRVLLFFCFCRELYRSNCLALFSAVWNVFHGAFSFRARHIAPLKNSAFPSAIFPNGCHEFFKMQNIDASCHCCHWKTGTKKGEGIKLENRENLFRQSFIETKQKKIERELETCRQGVSSLFTFTFFSVTVATLTKMSFCSN